MLMTQTAQVINENIGGDEATAIYCGIGQYNDFNRKVSSVVNKKNIFSGYIEKKERIEVIQIEKTKYKVYVEELADARETPYDVIKRLIRNNKEKICCLEVNGGMKAC